MSDKPALVLVHGAWHGSWCWDPVRELLVEAGFPVHTVDLPSSAAAGPRCDLHDDARVIRERLAAIDGPVVVVGHSYGGAAVSEGAEGLRNVQRLVYLAAWQLDAGESVLGFRNGNPPPWWDMGAETTTVRNPGGAFYHDVDQQLANQAIERLVPISTAAFTGTLTAAAWRAVPSTYILCEHDRALPVELQTVLARRANSVRSLPSGHSPFLSMPGECSTLLAEVATC